MGYEIPVEERHIVQGLPASPSRCAIALAITEFFGEEAIARIRVNDATDIEINSREFRVCDDQPNNVDVFISGFDSYGTSPFITRRDIEDRDEVKPFVLCLVPVRRCQECGEHITEGEYCEDCELYMGEEDPDEDHGAPDSLYFGVD